LLCDECSWLWCWWRSWTCSSIGELVQAGVMVDIIEAWVIHIKCASHLFVPWSNLIPVQMSPRMDNLTWSCDAISSGCLASQGGLCFGCSCWPSFIFLLVTCPCLAVLINTAYVRWFQLCYQYWLHVLAVLHQLCIINWSYFMWFLPHLLLPRYSCLW
jgi:hypothetical protein